MRQQRHREAGSRGQIPFVRSGPTMPRSAGRAARYYAFQATASSKGAQNTAAASSGAPTRRKTASSRTLRGDDHAGADTAPPGGQALPAVPIAASCRGSASIRPGSSIAKLSVLAAVSSRRSGRMSRQRSSRRGRKGARSALARCHLLPASAGSCARRYGGSCERSAPS